ncbi:eukaryotic membrane protein family-domain-containing protein [Aspergillus pseudoustus]|uniref:Eukaryotic membrane protein family-domain-containing protein n=1 Tax=Aspergillus pseudoustus TaxID=1810923 RepID=A0ABR4L0N7_9EURO
MSCCGDREKGAPVALEEQWDYMNLDDFKSESCLSPFSYFFLFVLLLISIAVYAVDTFTAVTLLAFSRWAGQIEPAIPFKYSRWIFAVCIIVSFALLAWRWLHAIRAIRSGSVAQSYLDSLAARVQSVRIGQHGRGWRRFLVFGELTKNRKGAEYVALFSYFAFESWMNTVFADGPRQVVNAITLYSVMRMDLLPGGENAVEEDKAGILQFFDNVKILAEENNLRALVLAGMLFTVVIWVLSVIKLIVAIVLYLLFLFHHIPAEDGTLKAYCRRKINTRLKRIVRTKVNKALAKGVALQDRAPTNPSLGIDRKPTLPVFGDEDKTPIVSTISRTTTQTTLATLPAYSSRPGTAAPLEREPTLPSVATFSDKPPLSRTVTQNSAYSDPISISGASAVSAYSPLDRQASPAPPMPPLPDNASIITGRTQTPMSRPNPTPAPYDSRAPPSRMGSAAGSQSLRARHDPYSPESYDDPQSGGSFRPYVPPVDPYARNMTPGAAPPTGDNGPMRSYSPSTHTNPRPSPQSAYPPRSFTPGSQFMNRSSPAYSNDERSMRTFSPVNQRGPPRTQEGYTAYNSAANNGPILSSESDYFDTVSDDSRVNQCLERFQNTPRLGTSATMPDVNGLLDTRASNSTDRAPPKEVQTPAQNTSLYPAPETIPQNSEKKGIQNGIGVPARNGVGDGGRDRRKSGEESKSGHPPVVPDKAFGLVLEHSEEDTAGGPGLEPHTLHRTSLVDVLEGSEATTALHRLTRGPSSLAGNQESDRERVLKLSPAKIQELTSAPESIPYRAISPDRDQGRRASDGPSPLLPPIGAAFPALATGETQLPSDETSKTHPISHLPNAEGLNGLGLTPAGRSRPHMCRAVSTPQSARKQTFSGSNSERLSQTWASRPKQDRPSVSREAEPKSFKSPPPPMAEPPLPSPPLQSIPLPPLSIPTYLQLELASGRPSPLYIHRTAMSDFPYESARVKLERLMNFLMLPPALERVLWFGILACLDAWLYSFTILPLRFIKAIYILIQSWILNLATEVRYLADFVAKGLGRSTAVTSSGERDNKSSKASESRRRHRADAHRHRRQRSTPSALLPDHKADILKGLLMIVTCTVLMYFDASRMYHWIRGQAAIKLYVIYNVLEVSDRLFAAIGQDVLECLFSREALERRPDGRSKIFRPFGLFLLALAYTVIHSTALFYQVMTLNVAVNSYSNALITLLLSNQFVEIKSSVFKKFEKENLFQLTCADVVERFQLWLMLTIIASRNMVETGAFQFGSSLLSASISGAVTATNSTPSMTPPRTSTSILPQAFTLVPSSLMASFSHVNSFLPVLAQVLGPFLVVLGSEMFVDWLKHAYINKFNNTRPAIYGRFLDTLAKDYYTNAFGDQNLMRRLGLPIIPLSCLFFRVSVQTYQMLLAALIPQSPSLSPSSSVAVEATSLATIHSHYVPAGAVPSPPITLRTILPVTAAHAEAWFRQFLANAMPSPAQSVYIFTIVLILTGFILLLILKLLLGMVLLVYARSRYKSMKQREMELATPPLSSSTSANASEGTAAPRARDYVVEGSRRVGGWGTVEVNEDHRRWIYLDDPEALRKLTEKEGQKSKGSRGDDLHLDHVQRYEMAAKRIW